MNKLVFWGHHVDEYVEMFDLQEKDLGGGFLEFGCGPSAFNAEIAGLTNLRVSCDPLFTLDIDTLKSKVALVFDNMVEQVKKQQHQFDFSQYGNIEGLIAKRKLGLITFFSDYLQGLEEKRYQGITEIQLAFNDFSFDFALSSHYLFAELENQDLSFHLSAIKELARVAKEVRIFPLIDSHGQPSSLLGPVLLDLQQHNYGTEVRSVDYHLQPSGNAMLRVWAQACNLK